MNIGYKGLPDWMGFLITRQLDAAKEPVGPNGTRYLDISPAGNRDIYLIEANRHYALLSGDDIEKVTARHVATIHKQSFEPFVELDPLMTAAFADNFLGDVTSDYGYDRGNGMSVDIWWFDCDHAFTLLTLPAGQWGWIHGGPVHEVSERLIKEVANA